MSIVVLAVLAAVVLVHGWRDHFTNNWFPVAAYTLLGWGLLGWNFLFDRIPGDATLLAVAVWPMLLVGANAVKGYKPNLVPEPTVIYMAPPEPVPQPEPQPEPVYAPTPAAGAPVPDDVLQSANPNQVLQTIAKRARKTAAAQGLIDA